MPLHEIIKRAAALQQAPAPAVAECEDLVFSFLRIADPSLRKIAVACVRALSEGETGSSDARAA